MKLSKDRTLQSVLEDPLVAQAGRDAIRKMDWTKSELYTKTLGQLKEEGFGGDLQRGLERLYKAAETGSWFYPVYSDEERAADPEKDRVHLVWFPSDKPGAEERPYILLVPGGGFVNVWSLTEGWPVADHFNEAGYNVFILTYRVAEDQNVIPHEMEDMARAICLIRENANRFDIRWDRYITCGFSAGGYLVCLWSTGEFGHGAYDLPAPVAMFPVYPFVSWKLAVARGEFDPSSEQDLGLSREEAIKTAYEIPEHVKGFPPTAIFLAAGDDLVSPEHSKCLGRALDAAGIPCYLEIGPEGGHGFADGTGMCMAGWPERAIKWYEKIWKDLKTRENNFGNSGNTCS